ncbi:MAG: TrbI F-type domain-containing protein [Pseudomonadota bacterium]
MTERAISLYRPPTDWRALAMAGLAVAFSAGSLVQTFRQPEPPVFVSVSVKTLIEEHMTSMIGRNITAAEAERRSADYLASLQTAVDRLASEDSVIVIAGEAVLGGGAPDFTRDVRGMARAEAERRAAARGETLPAPGDFSGLQSELNRLETATETLGREAFGGKR